MNVEVHLAVGWALAHLAGRDRETRRFRTIVVAAAVLPDIDAVSYVFGPNAFANCHHALGHNVFFSILVSALSILLLRRRWLTVLLFTQLAFYTHYFGDYFLTRFELVYLWPLSDRPFIYSYKIGLDHPINIALSYIAFASFIPMAMVFGRTPLELICVELDHRFAKALRPRPLHCHLCGRSANERCSLCGQPVCLRHVRLTRRFTVICGTREQARGCSPASPSIPAYAIGNDAAPADNAGAAREA